MTNKRLAEVLAPLNYQWLLGATGVAGPGNLVVIFATEGDFMCACISHDDRILWSRPCGGLEDSGEAWS